MGNKKIDNVAAGCKGIKKYMLMIPEYITRLRYQNVYGDFKYRYDPTIQELEFSQSPY